MNILIDLQVCQAESAFRGMGRYGLALVKSMALQSRNHQISILLNGQFPKSIYKLINEFSGIIPENNFYIFPGMPNKEEIHPDNLWRAQAAKISRELFIDSISPDMLLIMSTIGGYIDNECYSIGLLRKSIPVAVVCHDLIPHVLGESHFRDETSYKEFFLRNASYATEADLCLCNSKCTRDDIIKHLSINEEKTAVIMGAHNSSVFNDNANTQSQINIHEKFGISKPYVMSIGPYCKRRNLENFFKAYVQLNPEVLQQNMLVLVGEFPFDVKSEIKAILSSKTEVLFTDHIDDNDLVALYRSCKLFAFPSYYEGLGLPVLEAMACGAPVICSNNSSLGELMTHKGAQFDPADQKDILKCLANMMTDETLRKSISEYGITRSKEFSWEHSASLTWDALERSLLSVSEKAKDNTKSSNISKRCKLAMVTPLPTEETGIAYYTARLLPALSKFYDIDVVTTATNVNAPEVEKTCNIISVDEFKKNNKHYDRIVYQLGNSPFHLHMFDLLQTVPGVIVLHDFFLSTVKFKYNYETDRLPVYYRELHASHGWQAVSKVSRDPWKNYMTYPCSREEIENSVGVIYHSNFSRSLSMDWYGQDSVADTDVVLHHADPLTVTENRKQRARKKLKIASNEIVFCSFGALDAVKLNAEALEAWLLSKACSDANFSLIFVGGGDGEYVENLHKKAKEAKVKSKIIFTGYADDAVFDLYLSAADVAIQLRTDSRGETSGTILDCLKNNLPTILNRHAAADEIDDAVVCKIPDKFELNVLSEAINDLAFSAELREKYSQITKEYIKTYQTTEMAAEQYYNNIEAFYKNSLRAHFDSALSQIPSSYKKYTPDKTDLKMLALSLSKQPSPFYIGRCLYFDLSASLDSQGDLKASTPDSDRLLLNALLKAKINYCRLEPIYKRNEQYFHASKYLQSCLGIDIGLTDKPINCKDGDISFTLSTRGFNSFELNRIAISKADLELMYNISAETNARRSSSIFVDISGIVKHDLNTGVERVTKSVLENFIKNPLADYELCPVYSLRDTMGYFHATEYMKKFTNGSWKSKGDGEINYNCGDVFFGLDLQSDHLPTQEPFLDNMSDAGVVIKFLVHDLLPVLLPNFFPPEIECIHKHWLSIISKYNGAICVSNSVADELHQWLRRNYPNRLNTLKIDYNHHGADIASSHPSMGLPENAHETLDKLSSTVSFLMVGTVEPRKGHKQTLKAFESIWEKGGNETLVIVGKAGWMMEEFVDSLWKHKELNKRLFFLQGISDEYLQEIYTHCSCLLFASEGEGFGLPIIEAAHKRMPIIARDIPVFKEIAGNSACYFKGLNPEDIEKAILEWLDKFHQNSHPKTNNINWLDWDRSVTNLKSKLFTR